MARISERKIQITGQKNETGALIKSVPQVVQCNLVRIAMKQEIQVGHQHKRLDHEIKGLCLHGAQLSVIIKM